MACLILALTSTAEAQEEQFEAISEVMEAGSSKSLTTYLAKSVDLNIDGKEATYSRAQAEGVLKRFFSEYPSKGFEFNHKGASKSGLPYAIGQYNFENGNFRVWIRLVKTGNDYKIQEMSILQN